MCTAHTHTTHKAFHQIPYSGQHTFYDPCLPLMPYILPVFPFWSIQILYQTKFSSAFEHAFFWGLCLIPYSLELSLINIFPVTCIHYCLITVISLWNAEALSGRRSLCCKTFSSYSPPKNRTMVKKECFPQLYSCISKPCLYPNPLRKLIASLKLYNRALDDCGSWVRGSDNFQ